MRVGFYFVFTFMLVLLSNLVIDLSIAIAGSNYGQNSIKDCINDPELKKSTNILIGTSVSREINTYPKYLNLNGEDFFVCGVSAPVTNLDFHYLIIDLIENKYSLTNKKLIVEYSIQGALDSTSILEIKLAKSYIESAPVRTKIFWINGFVKNSEFTYENLKILMRVVTSLVFPINALKYLDSDSPFQERRNNYLDSVYDENAPKAKDIKMFESDFNYDLNMYKLAELSSLVLRNGGELGFLIPPSNTYYTRIIDNHAILELENFYQLILEYENSYDLRSLDDSAYFADCCHLNSSGQEAVEVLLDSMHE